MSDRFSPSWSQLQKPLNDVIEFLGDNDHLLVNAFGSAVGTNSKASSSRDVQMQLKGLSIGTAIPWAFLDTISALILLLPRPTRGNIVEVCSIETKRPHESLRPDLDGRWTVSWDLVTSGAGNSERISMIWYIPQEQSNVPLVPVPTLDYVAASVSLARDNLKLPALTLLLIAFESALWDDLAAKSITRHSDRIRYTAVEWHFKRMAHKLLFESAGGAERELREMNPPVGSCEIRKIHINGSKAVLQMEVDASLTGFLASETEETRETIVEKGLTEAMQRARKEGLLAVVPSQLDEMIIKLRNNLVHLPSGGVLDPPIPVPGSGQFTNLEELRQAELVTELMPIIVERINDIYVSP